ncbi:hypothetical protein [Sphingobium chungangianum]
MSPRFWLFSLASAGAALVSGLGLGLYATTPPRLSFTDVQSSSYPASPISVTQSESSTDLAGPQEINCKGCGPTLADRQMASMTAGWSGYDDPVVQHYEAQDQQADDWQPLEDAPPSPMHRLPANIDRFANGDDAQPQPTQLAQGNGAKFDSAPAVSPVPY